MAPQDLRVLLSSYTLAQDKMSNKVKISKDSFLSIDTSKNKSKMKLTSQIRGIDSKIYMSSFELDKDQVDSLISILVSLRSEMINV